MEDNNIKKVELCVEHILCDEQEIEENQMKEFQIGDGRVLLIKQNGTFHAVSAHCTHYNAPLCKGVLCDNRIRCPWHGAVFNIKTGDIEDYPGLDSLHKFQVNVKHGKVIIKVNKEKLKFHKAVKKLQTKHKSNSEIVIVIGGGAAGATCIETLRQNNYTGTLILITKEKHLPYNRTKLSKEMDMTAYKLALRSLQYYQDGDIQVMLNKEVINVDVNNKVLRLSTGESLCYTKLVLATGAIPKMLPINKEMHNVCYLRTPEDANFIFSEAENKKVVIIGSSFIGMEIASSLIGRAESVSVVSTQVTPFENVLGPQIGAGIKKKYEERGIIFYMQAFASQFIEKNNMLEAIELNTGKMLKTNLCIIGIGIEPCTKFLDDSEIKKNTKGFIEVDKFLQTNIPDVYAAGDNTSFPLFLSERNVSIGHWQMAQFHGKIAALNILGQKQPLHSVPFFWTVLLGKPLRYAGLAQQWESITIKGNVDELSFEAFYIQKQKVIAVATMNSDPTASGFAELLYNGYYLTARDIIADSIGWLNHLKNFCKRLTI